MPKLTCKLTKFVKGLAVAPPKKATAGTPLLGVELEVNGPGDTVTVFGTDATGARMDISGLATIAASPDDPAILKLDPPTGVKYAEHPVAIGAAVVTITATFASGTPAPITITDKVSVRQTPAGLVVEHDPNPTAV